MRRPDDCSLTPRQLARVRAEAERALREAGALGVFPLIGKPCHYCDTPPSNIMKTRNSIAPLKYSGIDRVNNSEGYVSGNCVPCCTICNRAKQGMSVSEFAMWAKRLGTLADQWGGYAMRHAA